MPPPLLAVLICAGLAGYLIFVPPINGLADNGDYYRAMYSNGIYKLLGTDYNYFGYVTQKFGLMKYFNEYHSVNFSSQPLFVKLAIGLNKLFYSRSVFDIRFMGVVNYGLYLGGIYMLTDALTYPAKRFRNYVIAGLVVLVFGDASFTLYFNSFFAEPQMLGLTLYSFSSILLLARQRYQRRWPLILIYLVSTLLLIANKSQNAPLALSFVVVTLGLLFLPNFKAQRPYLFVGMAVVLITGGLTYKLIGKEFVDINSYQTFSHGVLTQTDDPSKALAEGGVDEQYALMQNQDYYAKQFATIQASGPYVKKNLLTKLGFAWVVKYYATHLKQFGRLLDLAAADVMITQVKAVGDYTKASGAPPGKQVTFFTLYSQVAGAFFPQKFAFNCLLAMALLMTYAVGFYNDLKNHEFEGILRFFLVAGYLTIFIFVPVISIIGDGDADLAKHLFMVPVSIDLIFLLFISDVLNHRLWHAYRQGADAS
ncbi:glycan biosynthesis hexose transferase WsfD [Lactiplantibacillus garii]